MIATPRSRAARKFAKVVLACLLLLTAIPARTALACRCVPPPPPSEAAAESDAVFQGIVAAIEVVNDFDLHVKFDVSAVWKGPTAPTLVVRTANNSAACGYAFEAGAEYIVYAWQSAEAGLHTNTCTRTRPGDAEEVAALGPPIWPGAVEPPFRRGDANGDGSLDLSDAVFTLGFLFLGGPTPVCLKSTDADDSGGVDLSDAVYVLNHLFQGGASPPEPFLACGLDPTEDKLECDIYPACAGAG